jgi:hypothetical protein
MNSTPARLDAAIDHVAARMVAVLDDDEMTLRIMSALPERTSGLRWLVPQSAAIGAIVLAVLVWTTRQSPAPAVAALPSSQVAPIIELARGVAAREPGTAVRTMSLEPLERRELMERREVPSGDHERALPALAAFSSLSVVEAQTSDIALPEAIGLAAIEIADLKLTAESFTTQKEE